MSQTQIIEPPEDWSDVTWQFVSKVCKYVPGSIGWIARQQCKGVWTNTWGFVIGDKFGAVELDDMRNADDVLIRQVATQMLGYAPDSEEDLKARLFQVEADIADIDAQIRNLSDRRGHYEYQQAQLVDSLSKLQPQGEKE